MREPYRVACVGTGKLAGALMRMIDRLDSVELVGVRSWNPEKKGRDVGEIIGTRNLGVQVTLDPDDIVALQPDAVVHAALDDGIGSIDDEIIRYLGAGINVITACAFRHFHVQAPMVEEEPWWPGKIAKMDAFREAANSGGATLYNTGVNPDFFVERLCLTLSGLCSEVDHIYMQEVWRGDTIGKETFAAVGFGLTVEEALDRGILLYFFSYYIESSMRIAAERMGRPLSRIERSHSFAPTPTDYEVQWADERRTVGAGTVGSCEVRCEGYSGEDKFITALGIYYLGEHMRPPDAIADDYYVVEIEGRPSMKVSAELFASVKDKTARFPDDPTPPGYYALGGPMIQAIPVAVEGPPGLMDSFGPVLHYRTDLRDQRLP